MIEPPTRKVFAYALPITLGVLGLMLYWFAFANRAVVFLYDHDMGLHIADTSAFSWVTRSRYWMTGLVASGVVLVLHTMVAWLVGRWRRGYRPPQWRQVWRMCAPPVGLGVLLITMTLNTPVLPLTDALLTALFTLAGLAFALAPGAVAATAPQRFFWLAIDGLGVATLVFCFTLVEQAVALMQRGSQYGVILIAAGAAIGMFILAGSSWAQRRPGVGSPNAGQLLAGGVCWAYLLLPAAHHFFFSDGWFYITTMDNFFPSNWMIFVMGWTLTALLVALIVRRRRQAVKR